MYNSMNVTQRPYMPKGQGYNAEEESNEQTQDSLHQNSRQNSQAKPEPRTIARGRAPQHAMSNPVNQAKQPPPTAGGRVGKPITMGVRPRQLPPKPVRPNQQNPQAPMNSPQQTGVPNGAPMTAPMARPVNPMPQAHQPIQQPMPQAQPPIQRNYQQPIQQYQPMMNAPMPQAQADPTKEAQIAQMARNNKVNIAQVIKDFRGTYAAIGTPNCLVDEIEDYLNKVIEHTKGEAPSINFVQTNLQNAAVILDKYISDTLEKESKVVSNWLEALFLQRINYSYNEGEINEDFLVKFPKEEQTPQEKQQVEQVVEEQPAVQEIPDYEPVQVQEPVRQTVPIARPVNPQIQRQPLPQQVQPVQKVAPKVSKPKLTIIPEDNELKALFVQAKKQVYANNPAKAMNILEKALQRAVSVRDEDAQSKICYEMARIYDDNNYLAQALSNYNRSLQVTTDTSMKTKAHYSMAKIYDDVNQFNSAINHYLNSVSYAGKEDNLSSQSKSLTNIANIYTDQYDPDAFIFYDEADVLVRQTDDSEMKGYVSSNTAGAFNKFNLPDKALQCYAQAVQNYTDAKQSNHIAENYKAAGELMFDLKHSAKAKVLLNKALMHTDKIRDKELISQIRDLLEEIG